MQYENAVGGIVGAFEIAHHLLIVEKVGAFKVGKGFFVGDIQVGDILECGFGLLSVMVCNIMLGYTQDVMPDVFYFPLSGESSQSKKKGGKTMGTELKDTFVQAYNDTYDYIDRYLTSKLPTRELIEDALQSVYLDFYRSLIRSEERR